jgi:hypothetical protein
MLRFFDTEENMTIDDIPHRRDYAVWLGRLSREEQDTAFTHIESLIGDHEIRTSSWMPGAEWQGTPLSPLYEKAARYGEQQAGWCFGLMLMQVMIQHPDQWFCKKAVADDEEDVGCMIYRRAPQLVTP